MNPTQKKTENGIRFGDWMLVPVDNSNWELAHWHVAKATGRHSGGTEPQWNRLGRFYQYGTFPLAIQYAADCELKDGCNDSAVELLSALFKYERIVDSLKADVLAALDGAR